MFGNMASAQKTNQSEEEIIEGWLAGLFIGFLILADIGIQLVILRLEFKNIWIPNGVTHNFNKK